MEEDLLLNNCDKVKQYQSVQMVMASDEVFYKDDKARKKWEVSLVPV